MTDSVLSVLRPTADALDARLRVVVRAHYDALWRFLRRMGVPDGQVEDAAQQVLLVFARRADDVAGDAERPFLFGTALRVASDFRRKRKTVCEVSADETTLEHPDPGPDAEALFGQMEQRRCLDRILDELAPEQRAVFVLVELEELTMDAVSRLLSIPAGTVASRLRRARELVELRALAIRAQLEKGHAR